MRTFTIVLICLLSGGIFYPDLVNSQISKRKLGKANTHFKRLEYSSAIPLYEKLNKSSDTSIFIISRLAECYRLIDQPDKAEEYYSKAVSFANADPKLLYDYSYILRENKKYVEADKWMANYNKIKNSGSPTLRQLNNQTYTEKLMLDSYKIEINPVAINSPFADWGTTYYNDKIVFSSSRNTMSVDKNSRYKWNNESFLTLYTAEIDSIGNLTNVMPFSIELNSKFHDGPVCFTSDYNTIYYTRNNYLKQGKKERRNKLEIYSADYKNDKWSKTKRLWFNTDEYSCGQASVSKDKKRMFFVSDMPGGFGGTDIYVSDFKDDKWGKPENLGMVINTAGNEMFPFIYNNDTLFFASDGYIGLGGLDLYYAAPNGAEFEQPHSMGDSINSSMDDFALIIDLTKNSGYFSSNRENFDDNIYKISFHPDTSVLKKDSTNVGENLPGKPLFLKGIVTDKYNKKLLAGTHIAFEDKIAQRANIYQTENNGKYLIEVTRNKTFDLNFSHKGYLSEFRIASTTNIAINCDTIELNIELIPGFKTIVYFDLDKYNIRSDAKDILNLEVLEFLKSYPNAIFKLSGHTDSRASFVYNNQLSLNRINSVVNYLVKNGAKPKNVQIKEPHGKYQLVNKCKDGVYCPENEHQLNRRVEVDVYKW